MKDPLIEQYEKWAYPMPIKDLPLYVANGGHDFSDPRKIGYKLWSKPQNKNLNILVAGCGVNQAAILAYTNPNHSIYGVDLSSEAIKHHQYLEKQFNINNLYLAHGSIDDIGRGGVLYDYIITTGVLHHLEDPAAGLNELRKSLAPDGVMSVMLYGKNRREGVYTVQNALRTLGVARTPDGVNLARSIVGHLPKWHSANHYIEIAPDLNYDAGFIDTFLNARDTAYTVPEILELVDACGLKFQSWVDGLHYSPAACFPPDSQIHDYIYDLPIEKQWHIVDLLAQPTAVHRFILTHKNRASICCDFSDGSWINNIPSLHSDLKIDSKKEGLTISREWHRFSLTGVSAAAFGMIDGNSSFTDILSRFDDSYTELLSALFEQLYEWDHIYFFTESQE